MQVLLALAAYNEQETLPRVLERFRRMTEEAGYRGGVVIVDDGSTDGTAGVIQEWASRLPVETLRHPVNRGLGETLQGALGAAVRLASAGDVIVTMDADDTHAPELVPTMVDRLAAGHDVVVASRYCPGSRVVGVSGLRTLMSYGARLLFQAVAPIPGVRDYTSGFRAYRVEILESALRGWEGRLVTERGFAAVGEILIRLARMGARVCEVPMELRYDRKHGASKMRVGRTVFTTLRMLARNRSAGQAPPVAQPTRRD